MAAGQFTQAQIYQSWIQNGAQPQLAQIMSAIAMAESGGYSAANNNFEGHNYMGLYQIGDMHGDDPSKLHSDDINYQTQAAMRVLQSQGITAWQTYTTGAYTKFMQPANSPALSGQAAINELLQKQAAGVPLDSFESAAVGGSAQDTGVKFTPWSPSDGVLSAPPASPVTPSGPTAVDAPGQQTMEGTANPLDAPGGNTARGNPLDSPIGFDANSPLTPA